MNDPPSGDQVALACTRCDWKGPRAEAACDFTFLVPREWLQEVDLILAD